MFQPVKTSRMAETVVAQIRAAIESGQIRTGERLSGERVLAEQFSVSRGCVREALRILEVMGFVKVRQGRGAFVSNSGAGPISNTIWLPWLAAHKDEVLELQEVRDAIETKVSALAALNATEDDLDAIRAILDEAQRPGVTADEAQILDFRFHEALANTSKNRILVKLSKSLGGALSSDRRAVFEIPGRIESSFQEHRRVFDALVARDPVGAAREMSRHVASVKEGVSTVVPGRRDL